MVNIYDIIQVLAPEYKITKNISKKQHLVIKEIEKCKFTNFEPHGTFRNLFSCLVSQHESMAKIADLDKYQIIQEDIYDQEVNKLKEYIETHVFNPLINTKKLLSLITQNTINNELILFLSGYFNSNIYIYSFESKLLKIYYLEEQIDPDKNSYVIVNKKDLITPNIGFQTFNNKIELTHQSPLIVDLCTDIYTIAIGLKENKTLQVGEPGLSKKTPAEFNLGILEKSNVDVILDDNIFNDISTYELEDDEELNSYDPLGFNIDLNEIYKKYSKENLMKCICKYYIK